MSYQQVGTCSKCGAPYYQPDIWMGILPPPITYSCNCYNTLTYKDTTEWVFPKIEFPNYKKLITKVELIEALKRYQEDTSTKAEQAAFEAVIEWFVNCTPEYGGE